MLGAPGRGAAWLARVLWEHEVGGSNPPAPTLYEASAGHGAPSPRAHAVTTSAMSVGVFPLFT